MGPFTVQLGQGGRITVPAALRRSLGLTHGSAVPLVPDAVGLRLMEGALSKVTRTRVGPSPTQKGRWERAIKCLKDFASLTSASPDTQAHVMQMLLEPYLFDGTLDPALHGRLLGPLATTRTVQVIVADSRTPLRREAHWWRFRDGSKLFVAVRPSHPPLVAETDADGLSSLAMVDQPRALRAALESDRPELVEAYIRCHGTLPRLDQELLLLALESPSSAVRLAAIASLSTSASPPRDENGVVAGEGSREGDRHPDPDRGSVAGAAPADIPVAPDQTAGARRDTPAPEAP
jgi:bifunctional DNA-binding transcriptional regulator/antitoxin component of YhaV-PrlF toxin-antitoxin module